MLATELKKLHYLVYLRHQRSNIDILIEKAWGLKIDLNLSSFQLGKDGLI